MAREPYDPAKSAGTDASDYSPDIITCADMIGKVAYSIIREVNAKNPLSRFDTVPVQNGDTIEEAVVKLVQSQAYDPTGAGALVPDDSAKMAVRYYNNWKRKKFKTTTDISELRKAMTSDRSAEEVARQIVAVLSQSDIHDKYLDMKGALLYARTAGSGSAGGSSTAYVHGTDITISGGDYSPLISYIKDVADSFDFVGNQNNTAGLDTRNDKSNIRIIMPYWLKNKIDVETLTGYFNLSKGEIEEMLIKVDIPPTDGVYPVWIIDKWALQNVTRLYMMLDEKNADAGKWNYYLHVERCIILCELFNAIYFDVTVTEQVPVTPGE